MKTIVLVFGAVYGFLSVAFGAFGAHALKKVLSPDRLEAFETAVRYQMYHALVLLAIGFYFSFQTGLQKGMAWSFIVGTFLFSGSIYLLSLQDLWNANFRFLGPVTPLGGMLFLVGWVLLMVLVLKSNSTP